MKASEHPYPENAQASISKATAGCHRSFGRRLVRGARRASSWSTAELQETRFCSQIDCFIAGTHRFIAGSGPANFVGGGFEFAAMDQKSDIN